MSTQRLTVYLLQPSVESFDDALAPDAGAIAVELTEGAAFEGNFYYEPSRPRQPSWLRFVAPALAEQPEGLTGASASGLLLLRADDRVFAFTFGYGRKLLDLAKIEHQFGLRVALNSIDPTQIRSLDKKTFEDIVITTNTQVSKSAELPAFGIDISSDILRAVTGEPSSDDLGKRVSGADSLVVTKEDIIVDELGEFASRCLTAYQDVRYKAQFGWIDQLGLVRDSSLLEQLDESLVTQLAAGDTSTSHLAMPEAIEWEDIGGFKIGPGRRHVFDDLDLDEYIGWCRDNDQLANLTVELLRNRRVSVIFSRSGNADQRWSLYHCLVSEQTIGGTLYALIEGRWFRVDASLVEQVEGFMSQLPPSEREFIPAAQGEIEAQYNERLAAVSDGTLVNLDGMLQWADGAASGIEVCDLLSTDGEFIHVKRKARSSTLSHLFAQGSVSATAYFSDPRFREQVQEAVAKAAGPSAASEWAAALPSAGSEPMRSNFSVTYVVIANSSRAGTDWLPFFSKLNLMQHGRRVRNELGLKVSIVRVPVGGPAAAA